MKTIQQERRKILKETVKYYKNNPRCIGNKEITNIYGDSWIEFSVPAYNGITLNINTKGCAIGRLLPENISIFIDNNYREVGINEIWKFFPENLKILGKEFFIELSCLHDNSIWWFKKELSEQGKLFYKELIKKFC